MDQRQPYLDAAMRAHDEEHSVASGAVYDARHRIGRMSALGQKQTLGAP
jgi:hypothetical protein